MLTYMIYIIFSCKDFVNLRKKMVRICVSNLAILDKIKIINNFNESMIFSPIQFH